MPTFRVFGASKRDGADTHMDVDAEDESHARQQVVPFMVVSSASQLSGFPSAEPPRPFSLEPVTPAEELPDLVVAASVCWWLGVLAYLSAVGMFIKAIATVARPEGYSDSVATLFLPCVAILGVGGLLQAVSGICRAVRIIALNSRISAPEK